MTVGDILLYHGMSFTYPATRTVAVSGILDLDNSTIASGTATSAFLLNYTGGLANQKIFRVVFTDVDASGGQMIYNYIGGTLTRTNNITNVTCNNVASSGFAYL